MCDSTVGHPVHRGRGISLSFSRELKSFSRELEILYKSDTVKRWLTCDRIENECIELPTLCVCVVIVCTIVGYTSRCIRQLCGQSLTNQTSSDLKRES